MYIYIISMMSIIFWGPKIIKIGWFELKPDTHVRRTFCLF